MEMSKTILEDLEYRFGENRKDKGTLIASFLLFFHLIVTIPPLLLENLTGGFSMFKNYFKITLRNIKCSKLYSALNIIGLAVGLASFSVA